MFIGNLIAQWQELLFNKKQSDSVFYYSLFSGQIARINFSCALFRIVYRCWNIFYLVIHMKMDCTIIRAEEIARWYVLIKLIVISKKKNDLFRIIGLFGQMEYLFLDAFGWWLSIKWDSCFCCISSLLS